MKTRVVRVFCAILLIVLVCGFTLWLAFRNPYNDEFFTGPMRQKYHSVEAVLNAFRVAWKGQSKTEIGLLNEVYGWDKFAQGPVHDGVMPQVKRISYYRSKKLAVVDLADGSANWYVWRKSRWVFYPETPRLPFLEMFHGVTHEDVGQVNATDS